MCDRIGREARAGGKLDSELRRRGLELDSHGLVRRGRTRPSQAMSWVFRDRLPAISGSAGHALRPVRSRPAGAAVSRLGTDANLGRSGRPASLVTVSRRPAGQPSFRPAGRPCFPAVRRPRGKAAQQSKTARLGPGPAGLGWPRRDSSLPDSNVLAPSASRDGQRPASPRRCRPGLRETRAGQGVTVSANAAWRLLMLPASADSSFKSICEPGYTQALTTCIRPAVQSRIAEPAFASPSLSASLATCSAMAAEGGSSITMTSAMSSLLWGFTKTYCLFPQLALPSARPMGVYKELLYLPSARLLFSLHLCNFFS
jgi:hypothetical protein